MARRERDVAPGVPVLRDDHVAERRCQTVDDRDDRVALGHGQRATGHEAVLDVDHGQHVGLARGDHALSVGDARRQRQRSSAGGEREKLAPGHGRYSHTS